MAVLSLQGLNLLENRLPPRSFARLRLVARETAAEALGAVAIVNAGGVRQQDHVRAVDGFQTQVPLAMHFGLGDADAIESIEVRWPSGAVETWEDLPVGQRIVLVEGEAEARLEAIPSWPAESRPTASATAELAVRVPDLDGAPVTLARGGRPTVVNFWAPWCAPCKQELPELARLARELESEVDFVGVSVETADVASVRTALADFGIAYPQRLANDDVLERFHGAEGSAALPSTFVFGPAGELRRVFRRAVTEEDLRPLLHEFTERPPLPAEWMRLGVTHVRNKDYAAARQAFQRVVDIDPERFDGHLWLAKCHAALGAATPALEHFERAQEIEPDSPAVHRDLAMFYEALDPLKAMQHLGEAVRLMGDSPGALKELIREAERIGDLDDLALAVDLFERLVVAEPTAGNWTAYGLLLARHRRYADSVPCFEEALELAPGDERAQRALDLARSKLEG